MTSVLVKFKNLSDDCCEVVCSISSSGNLPLYLMGDNTKLVRFSTDEEAQAYVYGVSSLAELINVTHDYQIIKKREEF